MFTRWVAAQMWLFVPVKVELQKFMATIPPYPFLLDVSMSAAGIDNQSLEVKRALMQLQKLEPSGTNN